MYVEGIAPQMMEMLFRGGSAYIRGRIKVRLCHGMLRNGTQISQDPVGK